jgi:hypothetical protein
MTEKKCWCGRELRYERLGVPFCKGCDKLPCDCRCEKVK